jgi:preprotein translocase SecE subunit
VARDRQRAKQRRSRQAGAGGSSSRPARPRTGRTPAPDPLKGAFPDVEEAELAEAGATPPDVGEEFPPEEDLESERAVAAAPDVLEQRDLETPARRPGRGKLITFLGHVIDELRRVQWPDRRQVGQGTLVTLIFVLVAGGYLGLLDAIWKPVIEAIL